MKVKFPALLTKSVLGKCYLFSCPSFYHTKMAGMFPYLDLLGEMCNILIWLIPRGQHSTFVFHELLKLTGELLEHLCLGQELL